MAELVVCVDDDDPTLPQYRDVCDPFVGPHRRLCGWLNLMSSAGAWGYHGFMCIGDDVRPRTPHWDVELCSSHMPLGITYGNDLHQRAALPTHPIIDADIVRTLGWMCPPGIEHLYPDNAWKAIGERLNTLVYRDDVILEHMHPHAGKADIDDGYRAVNSRQQYARDRAAFERYMAEQFERDMERLCPTSSSPAS